MRHQTLKKKRTEKNAQEAMLPFLEEQLVRAESKGSVLYGIVIPASLIQTYSNDPCTSDIAKDFKQIYAIWKPDRESAIKAYEKATEESLRPAPLGLLDCLNLREWQLELIDQEAW